MNYRLLPLIIVASMTIGGCQGNPGGLSDREFRSLPPDRQAELRMEQQIVNEKRTRRIEHEMDQYDRNASSNQIDWQREAERDAAEAMRGKDLSGLR